MNIAQKLRFIEYTYKEQLIIAIALIHWESYIAGYSNSMLAATYSHQEVWTKFKREQKINPANAPYMFKSNRG